MWRETLKVYCFYSCRENVFNDIQKKLRKSTKALQQIKQYLDKRNDGQEIQTERRKN